MSLEIKGKVVSILPEQSGQGKNGSWIKQDFVIETEEQFPKKVCFSAWGDKASDIKKLKSGESVTVSFNVESREFNNKWYTDLRIWKIVQNSSQSGKNLSEELPPLSENDIPMEEAGDDLPF
jgi:hypothetical protein